MTGINPERCRRKGRLPNNQSEATCTLYKWLFLYLRLSALNQSD
nr:MAG TPA: hypothetical protein [Caudoviricetes sp.]